MEAYQQNYAIIERLSRFIASCQRLGFILGAFLCLRSFVVTDSDYQDESLKERLGLSYLRTNFWQIMRDPPPKA